MAELLQDAELVRYGPVLYDPAFHDAHALSNQSILATTRGHGGLPSRPHTRRGRGVAQTVRDVRSRAER